MSKHRALVYGQPVPQDFFDALQEFLGSMVSRNFALTMGTGNQVQIVAGTGSNQVSLGIDGLWRYISATITTTVPSGAGTYDIFVTATDNSFSVNPSPPPPELDATNYAFALATPLIQGNVPAATHYRKVGEAIVDSGSRVVSLRQMIGNDGALNYQPGDIKMSGAANPPAGWLLCNGQAVLRSTYSTLYAALGGTSSPWGQGDGSTTFNVPDLRSRAPIGAGQGSGLTNRPLGTYSTLTAGQTHTGEEKHTLLAAESGVNGNGNPGTGGRSAAHTHSGTTNADYPDHAHTMTLSSGNSPVTQTGGQGCATIGGGSNTGGATARHQHDFGTSTESADHSHNLVARNADQSHNTMPPFAAVNYFVKT